MFMMIKTRTEAFQAINLVIVSVRGENVTHALKLPLKHARTKTHTSKDHLNLVTLHSGSHVKSSFIFESTFYDFLY